MKKQFLKIISLHFVLTGTDYDGGNTTKSKTQSNTTNSQIPKGIWVMVRMPVWVRVMVRVI